MTTFIVVTAGLGCVLFLVLTLYGVFCDARRWVREVRVRRELKAVAREHEG